MRDSNVRMIERQAEIITEQRQKIANLATIIEKLRNRIDQDKQYADFYKKLQTTILSNPALIQEWQSFMMLVKMVDPDEKKYADTIYQSYE